MRDLLGLAGSYVMVLDGNWEGETRHEIQGIKPKTLTKAKQILYLKTTC